MLNIWDSKNAERQRRAQVPTIKMDDVPTMKSLLARREPCRGSLPTSGCYHLRRKNKRHYTTRCPTMRNERGWVSIVVVFVAVKLTTSKWPRGGELPAHLTDQPTEWSPCFQCVASRTNVLKNQLYYATCYPNPRFQPPRRWCNPY
jgi:hypothetical protein